ncbi:MAG: DUF6152 family protein [Gammaproteobacteria bacterium]|nr:DUF6152 family protein [Gammaproteobacteria bacterium]
MRNLFSILTIFTILCTPMTVLSHHSFSAEFDVGRPVDFTGSVINIEWTNPHAWVHLAVEDSEGNIQNWAVEMLGVNALVRGGMSPQTVITGDVLTVTGFGSRDGTNTANASSVTRTANGESLWASARE